MQFFPAVGDVQAGTDGTTWLLMRTGVESSEWEVLDESGRSVARVDSPPRGRIRWTDAQSLRFVERDELDIRTWFDMSSAVPDRSPDGPGISPARLYDYRFSGVAKGVRLYLMIETIDRARRVRTLLVVMAMTWDGRGRLRGDPRSVTPFAQTRMI